MNAEFKFTVGENFSGCQNFFQNPRLHAAAYAIIASIDFTLTFVFRCTTIFQSKRKSSLAGGGTFIDYSSGKFESLTVEIGG